MVRGRFPPLRAVCCGLWRACRASWRRYTGRVDLFDRFRRGRRAREIDDAVTRAVAGPSPELLDALLAVVLKDVENATLCAAHVAGRLGGGGEGELDLLAMLVDDVRWPVLARTMGLRGLGEAQHGAVLRLAGAWGEQEDPFMRSSMAEALGKLDDPAAVPYLERLLEDESACVDMWSRWRVMDEAARSLVRWRERCSGLGRWIEAQVAELQGGEQAAAISLGYVRHDAAVDPLVRLALMPDYCALGLLEAYRSRAVSDALCAVIPQARESARNAIAQALGKNGDPSCISTLAQLLGDERGESRLAAARGLRSLQHPEARRVLAGFRDDADPDVRAEVRLSADESDPR